MLLMVPIAMQKIFEIIVHRMLLHVSILMISQRAGGLGH